MRKSVGALELLQAIVDEKFDLAYSKMGEVIAVYNDHPATLSHYFQENVVALQKARRNPLIEERLREIFSEMKLNLQVGGFASRVGHAIGRNA